ncbi:MAG: 50S ribosomal protein L16 [Candidatus Omnitrophica bacterium CG_4_8_14_3_um_filter_43_15]|nr:MAG: 50S ribosomal protein L16 [Candidatus Omnitrophica bacterium CG_4_8_14_3_um_filter_43_15]
MAMMPKRVKYRKSQRAWRGGIATRGCEVSFGEYGIQCLENAWIKNTQVEAARVSVMRTTQGGGKLYIRIFTDKPVTKKPAETRMGKGKGMPDHWVCAVKRGTMLMELEGIPMELAREAFGVAAHKLPFRTRFVARRKF